MGWVTAETIAIKPRELPMRRFRSCTAWLVLAFMALSVSAGAQEPAIDLSASLDPDRPLFPAPPVPEWNAGSNPRPELLEFKLLEEVAQKHPEPEHTGLAALVYSTAADFKAFPLRRSTWVILGIGGATAALAHPADTEVNEKLKGSSEFFAPGKYIGSTYVQVGTAVTLYVVGRYMLPKKDGTRTNKVSHLGFDLLRSLIVSQALTQGIKHTVRRQRPTGECCAFPSGHASSAFATASVLERHLGYRGAWPAMAIATYVGMSRLSDNRHYLSDVLFGASLGIASGWTVVGRHGRSEYTLLPVPVPGGVAVTLTRLPAGPFHERGRPSSGTS
jgi:hypothetical protein